MHWPCNTTLTRRPWRLTTQTVQTMLWRTICGRRSQDIQVESTQPPSSQPAQERATKTNEQHKTCSQLNMWVSKSITKTRIGEEKQEVMLLPIQLAIVQLEYAAAFNYVYHSSWLYCRISHNILHDTLWRYHEAIMMYHENHEVHDTQNSVKACEMAHQNRCHPGTSPVA